MSALAAESFRAPDALFLAGRPHVERLYRRLLMGPLLQSLPVRRYVQLCSTVVMAGVRFALLVVFWIGMCFAQVRSPVSASSAGVAADHVARSGSGALLGNVSSAYVFRSADPYARLCGGRSRVPGRASDT